MGKLAGGTIRVGTASWADPGFVEAWYPKQLPAAERLSWYAEHFNLVELNSSFYAIPEARMVERWCHQTPPGFVFDVKLHRLLSRHSTDVKTLPPDLRSGVESRNGKVILTAALEKAVTKRFLEQVQPLLLFKRMGAFLLQLSPSFGPRHHSLTELDDLLGELHGHSVAIELRNADWVSEKHLEVTKEFFRKRGLSFVSVDAPQESHFMILPNVDLVTSPELAYLRLHGRNAKGYIRGRSVAERFDYKYNAKELKEIAERAVKLAEDVRQVHVVYNNNTANYAPVNAGEFRHLLKEEYPQINTGPEVSADAAEASGPVQLELGRISR